jgi:transcriptional regulator with XRE-family HTH domain
MTLVLVDWKLQGRRVRRGRKTLDLTQGDLARLVSETISTPISREIIRKIEAGERGLWDEEIRALSTILHRPPDWIRGYETDPFDAFTRENKAFCYFPWGRLSSPQPLLLAA